MGQSPTLVVAEDDHELGLLVRHYLESRGFVVHLVRNGNHVLAAVATHEPDLVILDIGLPGIDGLTLCGGLRKSFTGPILMLTALGEEKDEIRGLETGADDYIVKPVRPALLLARLNSLLRRTNGGITRQSELVVGSLSIKPAAREVRLGGRIVRLSSAEFELLAVLARGAGSVMSRESIAQALRGITHDASDRSIDLRVSRIRKKLGDDPRSPTMIKSVHGVGYLLVDPC